MAIMILAKTLRVMKAVLESLRRLPEIMHQSGQRRQGRHARETMPGALVVLSQDIRRSAVRWNSTLCIEGPAIPNNPQQFTMIPSTNPVAGNCRVLSGGLS